MEEKAEKTQILLIEDNPADARLVDIYLQESNMIDCDLTITDELNKGLDLLEETEYDAILLDLTLPDSKGFNTIKTMIEEFPEYTIIVMTGLEDDTLALNSVKAGAQDFIVKGQFDSTLLSRTISYAIERHQLQKRLEDYAREIKKNEQRLLEAQKMARIGNWELDIVTNRMYWSDEVFRILGYTDKKFQPSLSDFLKQVDLVERDQVQGAINRTMEKGAALNIEYVVAMADGTEKVIVTQGQIQMSQKTGSIVLVGTLQDISSFRKDGNSKESESSAEEIEQATLSIISDLLKTNMDEDSRQKVTRLGQFIQQLVSM